MPTELYDAIRDVPNFPKEGITFKDITPLLADPKLLAKSIDLLSASAAALEVDTVVGIDARGFIFGAPLALAKNAGFVPIRKQGKLPWKTNAISYTLEYGENVIEIHQDAVTPGDKVMLVDDLLATGGTAAAAVKLLQQLGADIVCTSFLVELEFLKGRETIPCPNIQSILKY